MFNPGRLDLARRRRGLTKVRLAEEAGLTLRALITYEEGTRQPSPDTLASLSDVLEFPQEFFGAPDIDEPVLENTSFRALKNLTARNRDQALGSAALSLTLADWIVDRFNLPAIAVPQFAGVDPETAAAALRSEWELGERPIQNMVHQLEAHGVRVFSLVEGCRQLDAFSFWRHDVPFVFLDTTKSGERMRMDASHELGHLVMHSLAGPQGRAAEFEADAFGSAFLMPRGSVLADAPRNPNLEDILSAKAIWGVSAAALIYRMHKLGLLSDWQYRMLFVELSSRGGRRSEINGTRPESSSVLAQVFEALRSEGVSKSDVARDLHISPNELDGMIFGLVLTTLPGGGPRSDGSLHLNRPQLKIVS